MPNYEPLFPRNPGAPIAWGAVRDALAAVHNFETLLKSPRVGANVLAGLLPELLGSCVALREAFGRPDRPDLARFANERLDALEQATKEASRGELEARVRLSLEQVVMRVSGELGAAADLLDLAVRAEAPIRTEVALHELARASLRIGPSIAYKVEATVRLDTRGAECEVFTDAHVVARLVAAAIAYIRAARGQEIVIRARCEADSARLEIAPAGASSAGLPALPARLARCIAPTGDVIEAAARAIGARIVLGSTVMLALQRA